MSLSKKIFRIHFRFDAGGLIGFGHLGRIEAISDYCSQLGIEPIWVIRKRKSLNTTQFKYEVIWLSEIEEVESADTTTWINQSEENEATEFLAKVKDSQLVFIDHYSLYSDFAKILASNNIQTICLLDFIPNKLNVDFVIDYNVGAERELNRLMNLNKQATFFLGPQYAPIKPVLKRDAQINEHKFKYVKIGIYLGGVPLEIQKKLLRILEKIEFIKNRKIKWCISSELDKIKMQNIKTSLSIEYIGRQDSLLDFYQWTDLMIGASGVSFLERSFIGIPQILFKVADNQEDVIKYLPLEAMAYYAGDLIQEDSNGLIEKLSKIDILKLKGFAEKAFQVYDGRGQERFINKILELI